MRPPAASVNHGRRARTAASDPSAFFRKEIKLFKVK
jgi:hypothetical protein